MKTAVVFAFGLVLGATSGAYAATAPIRAVHLRPMTVASLSNRTTPLYARFSARLTPRGRAWVAMESQRLRSGALDPSQVVREAQQGCAYALNACNGDSDIEAMAFIVLMQTTNDQDQDLLAIMSEVKAKNNPKASLRNTMQRMNAVNAQQINQDVRGLQRDLDSMSELGDTESLRLQMAMDRLSKLMAAISDVEKKISDTDDSIIQSAK